MLVDAGGIVLEVADSGSGVAAIWIHGFPFSSELFRGVTKLAGYRHVVPDLPGFGRSPAPTTALSIDDYADVVMTAATSRGVGRAIVGGVSMGGYIAMAVARKYPERLAALVLIDTRETADDDTTRANRRDQAARIEREGVGFLVDAMVPKMFARPTFETKRELVERTEAMMRATSPSGAISALHAMAGRADSEETLRKLEVPALIVVGSDDVITPPGDAERMKRLMPHAEMMVLEECGHLALLEKPVDLNMALERLREEVAAAEREKS